VSIATCTRRLEFDAGHRLKKHESKCRNVHGHRYVVEITCAADALDGVGRVIDFAAVKHIVGKWIDDKLDHGFIVQEEDSLLSALYADGTKIHIVPFSPTAENLVVYIADAAQRLLTSLGIKVAHVRLFETPNCWADWSAS
jgi:6-pyruvoyltetrahydropterin/6-carboxytetrahydropterin synthase